MAFVYVCVCVVMGIKQFFIFSPRSFRTVYLHDAMKLQNYSDFSQKSTHTRNNRLSSHRINRISFHRRNKSSHTHANPLHTRYTLWHSYCSVFCVLFSGFGFKSRGRVLINGGIFDYTEPARAFESAATRKANSKRFAIPIEKCVAAAKSKRREH